MEPRDEKWGKYLIRRLIARGGMAEVFEADMRGPAGFSKPVCLKRVRPEYSTNEQFVQMFQSEARIVSMLQHPNIVTLFDFDQHEGQLFLAMELIDGFDLREILSRVGQLGLQLPPGFAVAVMDSLFAALEHAHTRRIDGSPNPVIHRDVSPHNILISSEGEVKLTDFGIAKAGGFSDATQTGVIKGKLAYLSPEQATGQPVTPSSDLFSAGLVFQETLTSRRVFEQDDDRELLAGILRYEFEPIPWLSDALNAVLATLLAKEPSGRFRSADAARNALHETGIAPFTPQEIKGLLSSFKAPPVEEATAASRPGPASNNVAPMPDSGPVPHALTRPLPAAPPVKGNPASKSRRQIGLLSAVVILALGGVAFLLIKATTVDSPLPQVVGVAPPDGMSADLENPPKKLDGNPTDAPNQHPAAREGDGRPGEQQASPAADNPLSKTLSPVIKLTPEPRPPRTETKAPRKPIKKPPPPKSEEEVTNAVGFVDVNVRPWANVTIDGIDRGSTPLKKLSLKAGKHLVVLENKDLGYRETVDVRVRPEKTTSINRAAAKLSH